MSLCEIGFSEFLCGMKEFSEAGEKTHKGRSRVSFFEKLKASEAQ